MEEMKSNSIDLAFFSPPYNIGTTYGTNADVLTFDTYMLLLRKTIRECSRTLNDSGRLIIEVADTIFANTDYIQLGGLIQQIAINDASLSLETRHINFISTKKGVEKQDHNIDTNFVATGNAHSNCHQILVFSKSPTSFEPGKQLYVNYEESAEHPCAEPKELSDFMLNNYFSTGNAVLDPFMGTANLGVEVLKRGGTFYGYEVVEDYFTKAEQKLSAI
jgi:DNA modification methylase